MKDRIVYRNPVCLRYFADPFVLKIDNEYYAYGTGPTDEPGREIPVLRSSDLVHWQFLGGALEPLKNANNYWAPEVTRKNGKFLLYYSASTSASDEDQRLRLAIADRPHGPFRDSGKLLLPEQGFSIDASPFIDPADGKGYLFFATDFERDEPMGTGLCVVPLTENMQEAAGEAKMVVRASAPWQVYERDRNYKGRIWKTWNCVEGPFVILHESKYYCFFSGGAWRGPDYGVGYAVAEHPLGPWKADASNGPSVLKGIPDRVPGPGHACITTGPDGKTHFMIYHAWDENLKSRRMCIDPLIWIDGRPKVDGPSTDERSLVGSGQLQVTEP